jgi:hypothetical protein
MGSVIRRLPRFVGGLLGFSRLRLRAALGVSWFLQGSKVERQRGAGRCNSSLTAGALVAATGRVVFHSWLNR